LARKHLIPWKIKLPFIIIIVFGMVVIRIIIVHYIFLLKKLGPYIIWGKV